MNILDTIIANKRAEVEERKTSLPVAELRESAFFLRKGLSLKDFLLEPGKTGIIAEFKKKSPSKGIIHAYADIKQITADYARHGASALSILTDEKFFGGSLSDLVHARDNPIPILRKDFIIDEYQLMESKAAGADAVLLIAACLTPAEVKRLAVCARETGLEVLLELHEEKELEHLCDEIMLVGINNRDLQNFEVDIRVSLNLVGKIPGDCIAIAESGISDPSVVIKLKQAGFRGFLIGETFMKEKDPGKAFENFVAALKAANKH